MPSRLIVNADDFGLTPGINRAVAELHDAGALTSATLMASGPAFADAVALARTRPALGIGCHVLLTDGEPVSRPREVRSLLARNGVSFRPKLTSFLAALIANQIEPDEIEREAAAQIRRLQEAGLTVTHVDTHKHTHIFPQVLGPLLRAADRTGVRAVRNPFEQPWAFPLSNGSPARTSQLRVLGPLKRSFLRQPQIASGRICTTNGTVGISATGNLDEVTLRNLLAALPDGVWELVCHPGYNDSDLHEIVTRLRQSREVELRALLAALSRQARDESSQSGTHLKPPALIHYGDLTAS
jgi:chitin disaccharide deacetylase